SHAICSIMPQGCALMKSWQGCATRSGPATPLFRIFTGYICIMTVHDDSIASRLALVRGRIDEAARRAGRTPGSVSLLPVSKTFGEAAIRQAVAAGVTRLGENKAQEIRNKFEPLADCGIDWVMIGHLQTNKAKDIARMASEIQSLDRLDLAIALDRRLQQEGRAI